MYHGKVLPFVCALKFMNLRMYTAGDYCETNVNIKSAVSRIITMTRNSSKRHSGIRCGIREGDAAGRGRVLEEEEA